MKIIQKLRPVGNVFRNVADVQTKIDVKLELYLGREPMAQKEHMKEQGATTACVLCLVNDCMVLA